jgi:hypothetical protein
MIADWVSGYMQARQHEERKQEAELRTAEVAAARAPRFFDELQIRIDRDIQTFHQHGGNKKLQFQRGPRRQDEERLVSRMFTVRQRERYPFVDLEVIRNDIMVDYTLSIRADTGHKEIKQGTFRIVADLQGRVHSVLNGEPYCDVAEISEFLLRPVFDCLR